MLKINSKLKLNDGNEIPLLGFGAWQIEDGKQIEDCISTAFKAGYRLIDTASIYGNEKGVGSAVRKAVASGIPREEIFVTTKLYNDDHDNVEKAFNESLKKLGLDYIDLYLIHWPVIGKRIATWKIFEKLLNTGKVKSIGVSNFTISQLQELMKNSEIVPAINQVEFSPWLYQKELLDFCKKNNIILEAYSPLTRGKMLNDKRLAIIAKKYDRSPAQMILRWAIQQDIVVIPKSTDPKKIVENSQLYDFEIEKKDIETINSFNENKRFCWNPEELD
ncbi:TPA: aldo/keto reductase [Candidatus Woesearchaeota archaeon]|nr:aldo/keto reductase [Candidatus Woesearchaeota archaeon]HIH31352.1 aldo/keto reductase [Candidatus Woesearchaeota archaeon]HIH54587.1 aldo/keto reductase [Candidatus Woesearchaeota archaeon]HIJ02359.1 aldo/keto reductase [Candidatus Woesearchaeota archaeon]HIJ14163.1 aldo/keto reductase [Candidatus Woesearchaeota archaeon]